VSSGGWSQLMWMLVGPMNRAVTLTGFPMGAAVKDVYRIMAAKQPIRDNCRTS